MGIIDAIKDKLSNIPGYTKPLTDASKALDNAGKAMNAPPQTPQQAYEAKEKAMNRNNPYYQSADKPATLTSPQVQVKPVESGVKEVPWPK